MTCIVAKPKSRSTGLKQDIKRKPGLVIKVAKPKSRSTGLKLAVGVGAPFSGFHVAKPKSRSTGLKLFLQLGDIERKVRSQVAKPKSRSTGLKHFA